MKKTAGKGGIVFRLNKTTKRLALICGLVATAAGVAVGSGAFAGSSSKPVVKAARIVPRQAPGTWRRLPVAPIEVDAGLTSVWTGTEMIISGIRADSPDGTFVESSHVAAAFNPATQTWRELAAAPKTQSFCRRSSVWTGKEMLVWGCDQVAFNPTSNTWRRLPAAPTRQGIVAWTGRELIGWGGGCCGDVSSDGSAYNPQTNAWRKLAPAPVPGQQSPTGAWTGRELVIFNGRDPEGKPVGGAAYNPATDTWRRIAPILGSAQGGTAVWDGDQILIVGAGPGLAYDPAANRYRTLPPMDAAQRQPVVIWTGKQLLVSGAGSTGAAYDPRANRWSPLSRPPLEPRDDPTAVWTGRELIVWGGVIGTPVGTSIPQKHPSDGAALVPVLPSPMPPQCCGG